MFEFSPLGRKAKGRSRRPSPAKPARLCLEVFEERTVPTTLTWIGPNGGSWSEPANWSTDTVPTTGDDLHFGSGGANTNSNDDMDALSVHSITCDSGFTGTIQMVDVHLTVTQTFTQRGGLQITSNTSADTDLTVATLDIGGTVSSYGTDLGISANTTTTQQGSSWTIYGTTILSGSSLTQNGTISVVYQFSTPVFNVGTSYDIGNTGTLSIQEGEVHYTGSPVWTVEGTINVNTGTVTNSNLLRLQRTPTHTGTLRVSGQLDMTGNLENKAGLVYIELEEGFYLSGNYTELDDVILGVSYASTLQIEVSGAGAYGHFHISGTATLSGVLRVTAVGQLAQNALFSLVSATTRSGDFGVDLPPPPAGQSWSYGWNVSVFTLEAI